MYVLITYDVATSTPHGAKRLRQVARACENKGQRVQNSVFECELPPADLVYLKKQLLEIIDPTTDSVRFYNLGNNWRRRVDHHGAKPSYDIDGPLMV